MDGPIEVGGGFSSSSSSISVGFIMFANSICSLLKKEKKNECTFKEMSALMNVGH